ncbi:DUF6191 domain-containing protein [Streptomyces sp. UH6]|uniref:DUF6191 domain-containing protein n=1 Tax=Streptomyces sp. UH6 TaxID=2748379 RepID=UPI0035BC6AD7
MIGRTGPWLVLFLWVGRHRRKHGGGGGAVVETWDELFRPSQRHVRQERERHLALRDDTDSGAPPHSVDLDAGKAFIRSTQNRASRRDVS